MGEKGKVSKEKLQKCETRPTDPDCSFKTERNGYDKVKKQKDASTKAALVAVENHLDDVAKVGLLSHKDNQPCDGDSCQDDTPLGVAESFSVSDKPQKSETSFTSNSE